MVRIVSIAEETTCPMREQWIKTLKMQRLEAMLREKVVSSN